MGIYKTGVQLFQWSFNSIKKECDFLENSGVDYVQTSPVQPHVKKAFITEEENKWWFSYQPVGFSIGNRLGTEKDFLDMVGHCSKKKIDVVVDLVMNHFVPANHISSEVHGSELGFCSTSLQEYYPINSFDKNHFNSDRCQEGISEEDDWSMYNCRLQGLSDLKTDHNYVREVIISFLEKLKTLGVKGFRIDAAKHIPYKDLKYILKQFEEMYIILEVDGLYITSNDYKLYPNLGIISSSEYARNIGKLFKNVNGLTISSRFENYLPNNFYQTFVEIHDTIHNSKVHEESVTSYTDIWLYNQAMAYNILSPTDNVILSSYIRQDMEDSPSSIDLFPEVVCYETYTCQHRSYHIYPLIEVKKYIGDGKYSRKFSIREKGNQIWWYSPGKMFVAVNSERDIFNDMQLTVYTSLDEGRYCNLIYSTRSGDECTLREGVVLENNEKLMYTVDSNGYTEVYIKDKDNSRVLLLSSYMNNDGKNQENVIIYNEKIKTVPHIYLENSIPATTKLLSRSSI